MADKAIWEYPTLQTASPGDVILVASEETTFNMTVQTLKDAMGEAASKPPVVRNGYWYVWDAHVEDYVNSGTPATGPQGPKGDTGDVTPQAQAAAAAAAQSAADAQAAADAFPDALASIGLYMANGKFYILNS